MKFISGRTTIYGKAVNHWPEDCIIEIETICGCRALVGLTRAMNERLVPSDVLLKIHGTAKWDSKSLEVCWLSADELEVVPECPIGEILDDLREHAGIENADDAIRMIDGE